MPPPHRLREPTGHAAWHWVVTDDGSRTLWDATLDETFHSGCGAVAETLIVYLNHSGVLSRLRQRAPTSVLEYGLGTATGFLLTAAVAEHYRTPLEFTALECSLLPLELFGQLQLAAAVEHCLAGGFAKTATTDPHLTLAEFAALPRLTESFCDALAGWQRDAQTAGVSTVSIGEFVELRLWIGDARQWAPPELQGGAPQGSDTPAAAASAAAADPLSLSAAGFDAVYFDPFSPEANPQLWTEEVFRVAAAALRVGGLLTSYCVKGSVRRAMQQSGLQVTKAAGPVGGKREVLVAKRPTS